MTTSLDRDEDVRRLAYFLWEKAGRPNGEEHRFWAAASNEIEGELKAKRMETQAQPRSVAR
ncbi:DUF2934 domain-containing protein [Aureimonas psammosilenae]|uniref:DUF2934 domain-containing protein n=1 Tax=Aureimonas psammosilenae TaxID=2495496 RepID=UPI00126112A7|nr:DUF2934 domain-containing protein [Aureimonas psammosilenae]